MCRDECSVIQSDLFCLNGDLWRIREHPGANMAKTCGGLSLWVCVRAVGLSNPAGRGQSWGVDVSPHGSYWTCWLSTAMLFHIQATPSD